MKKIEKLGWTIRKYRRGQGLTQEELAERAGIDRTYVSNIENGKVNFSIQAYFDIAQALGQKSWKLMREAIED